MTVTDCISLTPTPCLGFPVFGIHELAFIYFSDKLDQGSLEAQSTACTNFKFLWWHKGGQSQSLTPLVHPYKQPQQGLFDTWLGYQSRNYTRWTCPHRLSMPKIGDWLLWDNVTKVINLMTLGLHNNNKKSSSRNSHFLSVHWLVSTLLGILLIGSYLGPPATLRDLGSFFIFQMTKMKVQRSLIICLQSQGFPGPSTSTLNYCAIMVHLSPLLNSITKILPPNL
jgi:hypothetical protein